MNKCECSNDFDCSKAAMLWERVKSLYEDARAAGFQERFFNRYQAAHDEYRKHRHSALNRTSMKDIING